MSPIPSHFQLFLQPQADQTAVTIAHNARFTVLTSRLLRLEYNSNGRFQDAPSQTIWYRQQPVPEYTVSESNGRLHIHTDHLHLSYQLNQPFSATALTIIQLENGITWHYGDAPTGNLHGTYRTLDGISGNTPLEEGLVSRAGWAVWDDSATLIFQEDGWLAPRPADAESQDLYFFGYGQEYTSCLRDFMKLSGPVPLLPRWALGNWWSRYHAYTQHELIRLMQDFRDHQVPLSVCIVDMDWHLTEVGDYNGWTGYTWNRELFLKPDEFIRWLHEQGLKTALNLHPALGIRPYEAQYNAMARQLGLDPAAEETIPFNIADPAFARAYFELLHHPQEEMGVDFWWMDWQQGTMTGLPGLDPLWWLNHLHFYDLGRNGRTRPFIFSRWGGLGNHRYPIGFSGDTWVNWETLAFQPYFTATAANVGYSWWSHDIGGHMFGVEEPELYARWVQFGIFSPIMRLHSTKNPFHERRPWGYDDHIFRVTRHAMQLRHALIPYLYTQSWRNHTEQIAPIRPMYHDYPEQEAAYNCPDQYTFGDHLIVAPYTTPADAQTQLSRQVFWLPPGDWYHFFSGEHFVGNSWHARYGSLDDMPVFAKAGALVPLGPQVGWGGVQNPVELELHVFAGADGRFTLFEDDGESTAYTQGDYSLTHFTQSWRGREVEIIIAADQEKHSHIPELRTYRLRVHGIRYPLYVALMLADTPVSCHLRYDAPTETVLLSGINVPRDGSLTVTIGADDETLLSQRDRTKETCLTMLHTFKLETQAKLAIAENLDQLATNPTLLQAYKPLLTESQARALLEVVLQTGAHFIRQRFAKELLILWNNRANTAVTYQYNEYNHEEFWVDRRFLAHSGPLPRFQAILPAHQWQLHVDYAGAASISYP